MVASPLQKAPILDDRIAVTTEWNTTNVGAKSGTANVAPSQVMLLSKNGVLSEATPDILNCGLGMREAPFSGPA